MDSSWIRLTTQKEPWYKKLLRFARGRRDDIFVHVAILGGRHAVSTSRAA